MRGTVTERVYSERSGHHGGNWKFAISDFRFRNFTLPADYSGRVTSAADTYRDRLQRYAARADAEARASLRYSRLRLLTAGIAVGSLLLVFDRQAWWAAVGLGASTVVFVWLVVRHDRIERRRDAAAAMVALNRQGLARLARDWAALPPAWQPSVADMHPFAADLDVFGHASLAQVLGPVQTPTGRATLARWLLDPDPRPDQPSTAEDLPSSTIADVVARQEAVRELAPRIDLRQQLAGLARRVPRTPPRSTDEPPAAEGPDPLPPAVAWATAADVHGPPVWVRIVAVVLAVATTAGAVGALLGWVTGAWWLITGALGWGLRWWVHEPLERAVGGASGEYGLRPWAEVIALLDATTWSTPRLQQARAVLHGPRGAATSALRVLEQIVALSDTRHSVWLYVPLQTLTLWDLHIWWAIDRWRRRHGDDVRHWLDAVGDVEALAALASLAFDHPSWAFPTLDAAADAIEASRIGHPLLRDEVRVCNDVRVGPPGRFLLITGSNMSGKSTLLRAVGLNVVLAQAGGPVCAAAFRLPPVTLHTSMRIADSLELGVSLFMASLVRLQQIVVAAREAVATRRACYLLDEVLQGTNSAERQVAVRTVVRHLLQCEAIGVVTTHDLELAANPSFTARADSVHLQETLTRTDGDVTMTFDYRLRPGPARAGNALQLLRLLGLDQPR